MGCQYLSRELTQHKYLHNLLIIYAATCCRAEINKLFFWKVIRNIIYCACEVLQFFPGYKFYIFESHWLHILTLKLQVTFFLEKLQFFSSARGGYRTRYVAIFAPLATNGCGYVHPEPSTPKATCGTESFTYCSFSVVLCLHLKLV